MQLTTEGQPKQEYLVVRWGARTYLVPPDEVVLFRDQINAHSEPRDGGWGLTYLRVDDWLLPAPGRPQLPSIDSPPPAQRQRR